MQEVTIPQYVAVARAASTKPKLLAWVADGDLQSYGVPSAWLAEALSSRQHPPFDVMVVDGAQDINVVPLRFLVVPDSERPNSLFFAGDLGRGIFQQPFSWTSIGVDIRGLARTLPINYRTSHQIRSQADKLFAPEIADVDGNVEPRQGTFLVFNGPNLLIRTFEDAA